MMFHNFSDIRPDLDTPVWLWVGQFTKWKVAALQPAMYPKHIPDDERVSWCFLNAEMMRARGDHVWTPIFAPPDIINVE